MIIHRSQEISYQVLKLIGIHVLEILLDLVPRQFFCFFNGNGNFRTFFFLNNIEYNLRACFFPLMIKSLSFFVEFFWVCNFL